MKKSFLFALVLIVLVGLCFGGCSKSTIEINLIEECNSLSTNLVSAFFNQDSLPDATDENFYVLLSSEEEQDLTAITINNVIYKKDMLVKFSVGNNNFLEEPVWRLEEGKFYVALPTLFVEAKGGIAKIEAGNKTYMLRVYEDFGGISLGEVGAYGEIEGAGASKTTDSSGKTVVTHTRQSAKTFVGWELLKNGKPIEEGKIIYTKKLYEKEKTISYGIDVSVNSNVKGYSSGLYNYYENGDVKTPLNRVIDYTIAIPNIGNINFEINMVEKTPED